MEKKNSPKLSVIVPVYKAEKYIHKCIDCILNQTFKDFELILVDDGSPDNSGRICDEYARRDNRVRVIHKDNEGVSVARNTGIESSKADLLCFVDSDDWVEDSYLSIFMDNFETGTMVSQGILYDYEYNPSKNVPFFKYDDISFDVSDEACIVKYNILENGCPYGKLYEKRILDEYNIRFNKKISTHEDHLFVWQYIQHISKFRLSEKMSYHYMKYGVESLSSRFHPSEEYMLVADLLFLELDKIKTIYGIKNIKEYLDRIISLYILDQYLCAIFNSTFSNYRNIIRQFKDKLELIDEYYIYHYRTYNVIIRLLKMRFPSVLIFIVAKLFNFYISYKIRL